MIKILNLFLFFKGVKPSYVDKLLKKFQEKTFLYSRSAVDIVSEIPATWNEPYRIELWIDAPMHLLFLGIVKKEFINTK